MKLSQEQLARIKKLVADGYISVQKHPIYKLFIYNYTKKTQYEKLWNEETMMCRGLILDDKGNIKALPFKKFFNYEEYIENQWPLPEGKFRAYEKLDGSLGILYWIGDVPYIATRGSFSSEQALHASELLRTKYKSISFPREVTLLFEIIYPQNRVVVDYGDRDELVYLGYNCIGEIQELDEHALYSALTPNIRYADQSLINDYRGLTSLDNKKEEGFVVVFENRLMIKMKFKEYVRLHRLYTGFTKRKIWETMKNKEDLDVLMTSVDEEFKTSVLTTINEIKLCQHQYLDRATTTLEYILKHLGKNPTRKELAEQILCYPDDGLIFAILDKKQGHIDEFLWRVSYPDAEKLFRNDIDS